MTTVNCRWAGLILVLAACLLAPSRAAVGAEPQGDAGTKERSGRPIVLAKVMKVGDTERFVTEIDVMDAKTVFEETKSQRMIQRAEVRMTVEEVTELGATVTVVLERVAFEAKGNQLNGGFDSRDPEEQDGSNLFAMAMRPIVGAPLSVELSADRTIQNIGGMVELTPDDPRASLLFESFFGEESLKNLLQLVFRAKSDPTRASIGETWSRVTVDQTDFGALRKTTEYSLDGVENGTASISISGTIETADSMPGNPAATRVESSEVGGICLWYVPEGRLERFSAETTVVMMAGDEEFPFTNEIRSRVRIVHAPK